MRRRLELAPGLAILVACSQPATPPVGGPGPAPSLIAFARLSHPASLVQGRGRIALESAVESGAGAASGWITFDAQGRHADPAIAASLAAGAQAIGGGEAVRVFWGRTPVVASVSPVPATAARAGTSVRLSPPGYVFAVIESSGAEVWRFTDDSLAIVDAHDAITRQPQLPKLGGLPCEPLAVSIAPTTSGVAALIVECDPTTDTRVQELFGARSLRRFRHLPPLDSAFLVASDREPIVAGTHGAAVAIAHGAKDGNWNLVPTTVPGEALQFAALAGDGAVWTVTTNADSSGKDSWHLARDGSEVVLKAPGGAVISPRDLGVDAYLGITVVGTAGDDRWIAAEHPPAGVTSFP